MNSWRRCAGSLVLVLCLCSTQAAADWQLARQDGERRISVYVQDSKPSDYQQFYAVTRVQTRLSTVVAVLADVAAMPEWIARLRSAKLIKREADRDLWVHTVYRLPYPFKEREALLHSQLRQRRDGVVEVHTRAERGLLAPAPQRVRLYELHSTWRLTPEAGGWVKIEMWGSGSPGGYVPPLLFNYNLPDEPAQTLKHLRQMLLREKYQKKILSYIREPQV